MATSIINAVPEKSSLSKRFWKFLISLRPVISYDALTGTPQASFDIKQYHLGTSATVLRSLKTLLDYELIIKEFDDEGSLYYSVYDVFLQRWAELSL